LKVEVGEGVVGYYRIPKEVKQARGRRGYRQARERKTEG